MQHFFEEYVYIFILVLCKNNCFYNNYLIFLPWVRRLLEVRAVFFLIFR